MGYTLGCSPSDPAVRKVGRLPGETIVTSQPQNSLEATYDTMQRAEPRYIIPSKGPGYSPRLMWEPIPVTFEWSPNSIGGR